MIGPVEVLRATGVILYATLAVVLLRHSAHRPANTALALLLFLLALSQATQALEILTGDAAWERAGDMLFLADAVGVLWIGAILLGPRVGLPAWTRSAGLYGVATLLLFATHVLLPYDAGDGRSASLLVELDMLTDAFFAIVPLALVLRATGDEDGRGASHVLLATGIALWWHGGTFLVLSMHAVGTREVSTSAATILVLRALLHLVVILALARLGRRRPELRALATIAIGLLLLATAVAVVAPMRNGWRLPLGYLHLATYNVIAPLTVAYALLRHQLLGLDLRVRWGVSRSTVAAAFVAAFFLASEGAQLLVGVGNEWMGLAAAGALVFALAPLQRMAERVAERAVPVANAAPPAPGSTTKEEAYRRALRIALRDRVVTREEDIHLHELAEHMGIGAGRAMALRVEVERELDAEREGA